MHPRTPSCDIDHLLDVRGDSEAIVRGLAIEDFGLQACAETSPLKWHLAHTSWFFETFVLKKAVADYQPFHPEFEYLFNSYYNAVGNQYPRQQRGLLSRPTVADVLDYRRHVDQHLKQHWHTLNDESDINAIVTTGLHHERQHQELMHTDLKYNWWHNPLGPALPDATRSSFGSPTALTFIPIASTTYRQGHDDPESFAFDNETPAHEVSTRPFACANRLTTNGEYLQFLSDGGYTDANLWLADGWGLLHKQQWRHPLYWRQHPQQGWQEYTLAGWHDLDLNAPVTHLNYYEADAYARWVGARLPSEGELELLLRLYPAPATAFWRPGTIHPHDIAEDNVIRQLHGMCWQWCSTAYAPYPGFRPAAGALGEYNGKFMCNQLVLKGGSCFSAADHQRPSYRNFFYPADRWQMTGIRLIRDL